MMVNGLWMVQNSNNPGLQICLDYYVLVFRLKSYGLDLFTRNIKTKSCKFYHMTVDNRNHLMILVEFAQFELVLFVPGNCNTEELSL